MDLAKTLIRTVARAFYSDTKHILVIDALMVHSALPNEDLALLMGMQQKDLRKLCGKLKEDRLLAVHSRQETREGQQRPINKDYYYIDFHATIDAIKYRVFHLTQRVKDLYKPTEEKKDYCCPRCKSQYTTLEVLDSVGPTGFICHKCGGILEETEDRNAGDSGGHEKQSKLNSQLSQLLKLLQQIDSEEIPKNDFETAFSVAVPVQRNEFVNPLRATEPIRSGKGPPTSVKGMAEKKITPLEISLTTNAERTANELAAETQRKAELAAQNVLPVWHTKSTVTGENTSSNNSQHDRQASNGSSLPILKPEEDEIEVQNKETTILNDELAAYYAQIQHEKEKEAAAEADTPSNEEDEDEDDDGGDDEADFEDVAASTQDTITNGIPASQGGTKRQRSPESGSSAPGTSGSSPRMMDTEDAEEGNQPAAKRIRKDEHLHNGYNRGSGEIAKADEETAGKDSDEDDEEFEDAL